MKNFIPGQRWISESEPELGLGTVMQLADGRVQILFPASGELRQYAADNAPLKRVRFREGDTVRTHDDASFVVTRVREQGGLITYFGEGRELAESQLSDSISFHGAEDRFLGGHFDDFRTFDLRHRALELQHRARRSSVRGFVGGRIDLIPHQLYIAHAVSSRHAPRVLLSDEVGLGKTIEACLIVHRLLLNGRAQRVLVLVPDSLVHQWFVEMLRRFNLWLNIFDEERCESIEAGEPGANPFLDDQLILCSLDFLAASPRRAEQAVAAGWGVLVVDEAHHLEWSPETPSREYAVVEALSRQAEGLLLLTATPEQLGLESHFARLRLLDPERFGDFEAFQNEPRDFKTTADLVEKLAGGRKLTKKDEGALRTMFRHDPERGAELSAQSTTDTARLAIIDELLDLHGPGRVLFRNTRAAMTGFPKRRANLVELVADEDRIDRLSTEFAVDAGDSSLPLEPEFEKDPRVIWLVELTQRLEPEKVLVICRSREKALAVDEALRRHVNFKIGVFHEELTLVQRDRNAAWFAEDDGARMLICSEIGSEGRNFQFARHLVLFDLPLNPELLEQRIGRLDRIGQKADIEIYVPYVAGAPQEVLARWYHEGLNALETSAAGGGELLKTFGRQVHDLALEFPAAEREPAERELAALLKRTVAARDTLFKRLEQGRDRLLERNSFRPEIADQLVRGILEEDQSGDLESFMLDVFDHFGVHLEELAPRTYQLSAQGVITDSFPSIPEEGMIATFDRSRALAREDVGFLTWDHPMVPASVELLLASEQGNSSFAVLPDETDKTLMLEVVHVLEALAEKRLHVDRFLPATPVRTVVNHKPADVTAQWPAEALAGRLEKGSPHALTDNPKIARQILPKMLAATHEFAAKQAEALIEGALAAVRELVGGEVRRLKALQKVNDLVRDQEVALAEEQLVELTAAIGSARVRLDSVRLIWKGSPSVLRA